MPRDTSSCSGAGWLQSLGREQWGLMGSLSATPFPRQDREPTAVSMPARGAMKPPEVQWHSHAGSLISLSLADQVFLSTHQAALGHFHFCLEIFPTHLDLYFFLLVFQRGLGSSAVTCIILILQNAVILLLGRLHMGCHGSEDR